MSAVVLFRVKCATEFKQQVLLVGNLPILGNWNPNNGLKLATSPDSYPIWTCDEKIIVDREFNLEFKLVIRDGNNCFWESMENRSIRILNQKELIIVTYNNPNHIVQGFQRLISESNLQDLHLVKRRRIRMEFNQFDNDSDTVQSQYILQENNDLDSDLQSLFKDDSISENQCSISPHSCSDHIFIYEFNGYPDQMGQFQN